MKKQLLKKSMILAAILGLGSMQLSAQIVGNIEKFD
jgi:hypothetical protein